MKSNVSRRSMIGRVGAALAGLLAAPVARTVRAATKGLASSGAGRGYDPTQHEWVMAIDVNRCIGCGLCVEACKKENHVPIGQYYRTWVERYVITKAEPGSDQARGETLVESPEGGIHGFGEPATTPERIQHSFFVPKALQPLPAFSLRAGLPSRGDVRCARRGGVDRPEVLHRLRFLHSGLSVWLPVPESGDAHGREVLALLSSDYARIEAGLRGGLPDPGAGLRRSQELGSGRPDPAVLPEQPGAGPQAALGHRPARILRGHR